MTFSPRPPAPLSYGFGAGVIRIAWTREPLFAVKGREGYVYTATITEINVDRGTLPSEVVRGALFALIVRAPDGVLSRIVGVEMFCTMHQTVGAWLGLLLVAIEEA